MTVYVKGKGAVRNGRVLPYTKQGAHCSFCERCVEASVELPLASRSCICQACLIGLAQSITVGKSALEAWFALAEVPNEG